MAFHLHSRLVAWNLLLVFAISFVLAFFLSSAQLALFIIVAVGLTFTFGGLKITSHGEVESTDGHPIPGLYAAGELVGGLFYHNYPGGAGLVSGAVMGKLAGVSAGLYVKGNN